jgi:hypothetical protein
VIVRSRALGNRPPRSSNANLSCGVPTGPPHDADHVQVPGRDEG